VQTGAITCSVGSDLSVNCTAYELAGVGNINATVDLAAVYSATVLCNNPAGSKNRNNDIEPHETSFTASSTFDVRSTKNGRLAVPVASVSPGEVDETDLCPNGNWDVQLEGLTLESFSYTLTFAGFEGSPAIRIDQP
jgi:hypothetical protein